MTLKATLYFHTLRYLKFSQIYWRIWYRFSLARVDFSPRPELRLESGPWITPARRRQSLEECEKFSFLNETGRISELGWDGPQREKLWRYNQHYFDDLNSADSQLRSRWHQALIQRWIKENPPSQGTGWEPYPTSLRIVNWVKWHMAGHLLNQECLQNLSIQTRWLFRKIEWHNLGNHLFANAKALVFSGLFFEGTESQKWLDRGLNIISEELPEQVLPDGGNFERSPMYHTIFLEDILDLINLATAYPDLVAIEQVNEWRATAHNMLRWLEGMCHPDGEIAFFNDAAIGIAPSPKEIKMYACRLGITIDHSASTSNNIVVCRFADSGYVRLENKNVCALLDVAPIGPDYLPGHAHADTLSFELSLFGERIIVNCGTSQYGSGPVRLEERGTSAHNTVVVNNENSSEVWSGFRVARRAYPMNLEVIEDGDTVLVACEHDGYMRLSGNPVHKRTWQLSHGKLVVRDQMKGNVESAIARFHFHPLVQVNSIDQSTYSLHLPNSGEEVKITILNGSPTIEQSFFSPEFGIRLISQCLVIRSEYDADIIIEISWSVNG